MKIEKRRYSLIKQGFDEMWLEITSLLYDAFEAIYPPHRNLFVNIIHYSVVRFWDKNDN